MKYHSIKEKLKIIDELPAWIGAGGSMSSFAEQHNISRKCLYTWYHKAEQGNFGI